MGDGYAEASLASASAYTRVADISSLSINRKVQRGGYAVSYVGRITRVIRHHNAHYSLRTTPRPRSRQNQWWRPPPLPAAACRATVPRFRRVVA
eukprot:COSAG03_NODE_1179_length_4634_cov_2.694004_2_plen_94_part_00